MIILFGFCLILNLQVISRWEKYTSRRDEYSVGEIASEFPFTKFFENAPQPVFKGQTKEEDWEVAEGCFRHISRIFTQLDVSSLVAQTLEFM